SFSGGGDGGRDAGFGKVDDGTGGRGSQKAGEIRRGVGHHDERGVLGVARGFDVDEGAEGLPGSGRRQRQDRNGGREGDHSLPRRRSPHRSTASSSATKRRAG